MAPPTYDAVAEAPTQANSRATSAPQPNKVLAASRALERCNRTAGPRAGQCEIIRLGDQRLRTAAQLREAAGSKARKLFLWRYRSKSATVYLAGSIHMLKATLYPLNSQFQRAFDAADTLVLEIDPRQLDPATASQAMFSRGLLPADTTLNAELSETARAQLAARAGEYGIELSNLQRFSPMLAAQTLTVTSMAALGYPSQSGVEQYFLQQLGSRRVLELESLEQQLDLLFSVPLPVQVEMLESTLAQLDDIQHWLEAMVIAWLSGNASELDELMQSQMGESDGAIAFGKRLLDERNTRMADQIAGFLESSGTFFVLVGAAHYPGPGGILAALDARGFKGQQLLAD
ncbi:MAG: TraB/GumN family protein [Pseudomonadota bacterium]